MSGGQNVEHLIEEARKLPDEDYSRLIIELLSDSRYQENLLAIMADLAGSDVEQEVSAAVMKLTKHWLIHLYTARREGSTPHGGDIRHRITELRGLGKEVWQTEDAQGYVNAERESWNN